LVSSSSPPERRNPVALKDKYVVRLTPDHRRRLEHMVSSGKHPARVLTRARVLLKADAGTGGPGWEDAAIAEALDCGDRTVARVRQRYAAGGLDAALHAKKPTGRQYRKLDGDQEARLIAVACSPAPGGRARWTMKLLADKLVELEVVESIDPATVWRTLKKTRSSRGSSSGGSSRPSRAGRS
jgi:transposase